MSLPHPLNMSLCSSQETANQEAGLPGMNSSRHDLGLYTLGLVFCHQATCDMLHSILYVENLQKLAAKKEIRRRLSQGWGQRNLVGGGGRGGKATDYVHVRTRES